MTPVVVAIDGPAGSGKSSVSRAVAERLGWAFLDTGAAYRALAWHAVDSGIDPADERSVDELLPSFAYSIGTDPRGYAVRVGETDVSDEIRTPRVTGAVSAVARNTEVRRHLTALFRRIIAGVTLPGVVVEGRDITTIVAPDAESRILLTADERVRSARRSAELPDQSPDEVAASIAKRDRSDAHVVEFLTAAEGVTTVDSTHLDFEQTVDAVIAVIRRDTGKE